MLVTELILLIATFTVAVNIEIFDNKQPEQQAGRNKKTLRNWTFFLKKMLILRSVFYDILNICTYYCFPPLWLRADKSTEKPFESYFLLDLIVFSSSSAHKSYVGSWCTMHSLYINFGSVQHKKWSYSYFRAAVQSTNTELSSKREHCPFRKESSSEYKWYGAMMLFMAHW